MMRLILRTASLAFAIVLTGCSLLMTKPEVSVKGVDLSGTDSKGVNLEFLLEVINPNSSKLNLAGYSYDLLVSDMALAKGQSSKEMEFAGNSSTEVRLPARVEFRELLQLAKTSRDLEHLPYRLKAVLDLRTPFGVRKVPVIKNGTFAMPSQFRPENFLKKFNGFFK